jgi:hypothetical protein
MSSAVSYPFSEITADPNFPHVRSIHTKIRGVTKENHEYRCSVRLWQFRQQGANFVRRQNVGDTLPLCRLPWCVHSHLLFVWEGQRGCVA